MGVKGTVFMPDFAPSSRVKDIRSLGCEVVVKPLDQLAPGVQEVNIAY